MKNVVFKASSVGLAALSTTLCLGSLASVQAMEIPGAPLNENAAMPEPIQLAQVTNVSELSDVQPGEWAFTALQRLVEEYGCLEGYPDRSYRGNRALTRYEFAAGLNACLERVNELITEAATDIKKEDLEILQKLQEQFATELTTLRSRVDSVEDRTATLEKQQISTNTKLLVNDRKNVTGARARGDMQIEGPEACESNA